jgi:hypothetical protein
MPEHGMGWTATWPMAKLAVNANSEKGRCGPVTFKVTKLSSEVMAERSSSGNSAKQSRDEQACIKHLASSGSGYEMR